MRKMFGVSARPRVRSNRRFGLLALASALLVVGDAYSFYSVVSLKHTEGKGIGFTEGYSSLQYFGMQNWQSVEMMCDLRGHVFNSGEFAGNGGIGIRGKTSTCSLFGAYGFYDFRESNHLFAQQVSGGVECLTKWVDFRFNGYWPIGKTALQKDRAFNSFSGNSILVKTRFKGALPMGEFELGVPVRPQVYFTAGPYYLGHNSESRELSKSGWGGKVALRADLGKYFSFGGGVSYDQVFDFGGTGFAAIHIPFGGGKGKSTQSKCGRDLRSIPISRNEIIPFEKTTTIAPLGSEESSNGFLEIIFVNNTAPDGGNGSFESPFNSLAAAEQASGPGDVIYVFPGDGTSKNMDLGIALQEDQILVSSGHDFVIDGITIPALTPGELPVIENMDPNEPVVISPGQNAGILSDFFQVFNRLVGP